MTTQILPDIQYWDARSDIRFSLFVIGYQEVSGAAKFLPKKFAEEVGNLETVTKWTYSGGVDVLILNSYVEANGGTPWFAFDPVIGFSLERLIAINKDFSLAQFVEGLIRFSKSYEGNDPTWSLSDQQGVRLTKSAFKKWISLLIPEPIRADASEAFFFYTKDLQR